MIEKHKRYEQYKIYKPFSIYIFFFYFVIRFSQKRKNRIEAHREQTLHIDSLQLYCNLIERLCVDNIDFNDFPSKCLIRKKKIAQYSIISYLNISYEIEKNGSTQYKLFAMRYNRKPQID